MANPAKPSDVFTLLIFLGSEILKPKVHKSIARALSFLGSDMLYAMHYIQEFMCDYRVSHWLRNVLHKNNIKEQMNILNVLNVYSAMRCGTLLMLGIQV